MFVFTLEALLAWARAHETDEWVTLRRLKPFLYRVTPSGITYIPSSGIPRNVHREELESFCDEFKETGSFLPGSYPDRWHKSYTLPLIQRFLAEESRTEA